MIYIHTPKM